MSVNEIIWLNKGSIPKEEKECDNASSFMLLYSVTEKE